MSVGWRDCVAPTVGHDVDRLVFGLGRVHHLIRPVSRSRLVEAALHVGFRSFDVAPAYGNGLCERELGLVIRGMRERLRIHTKVGIPIRIYPGIARYAFPAFRAVDMISRGHPQRYLMRKFTTREICESLYGSLQRLGTDYVDTLFLHEPLIPFRKEQVQEILECVASLRREGTIRAFGVSGPLGYWGGPGNWGAEVVIQCPMSDLDSSGLVCDANRIPLILYQVRRTYCDDVSCRSLKFSEFLAERLRTYPTARFIVATNSVANVSGLVA